MSKYIIKNCPARLVFEDINYCQDFKYIGVNKPCQDCTDCLLKQIVEKCKNSTYTIRTPITQKKITKIKKTAQEILSMLEIQECE